VDFGDNFSAGHRVVLYLGIEASETAGWESSRLAFFKAISHSNFEGSRSDSDVFPLEDANVARHRYPSSNALCDPRS
jgi:hypothetical protein